MKHMPESSAYLLNPSQRDQAIAAHSQLLKAQVTLQQALREQKTTMESSQEALFLEMLEVVDALDAILEHVSATEVPNPAVLKRLPRSLGAIRRKLLGVMEKRDVTQVELEEGQPDFAICRVVDKEVRPDLAEQTITRVVRSGYRIGEKVLRPSEVIVSKQTE